MNNIVRTWEEEENLVGEIELTDAELAGVYGAGHHDDDDDDGEGREEREKHDEKKPGDPCAQIFIKEAIININCEGKKFHKKKSY